MRNRRKREEGEEKNNRKEKRPFVIRHCCKWTREEG